MRNVLHLISLIYLLMCFSCSEDSVDLPVAFDEEVPALTILNLKYGQDEAQIYDLYLPANRSNSTTKVLILIHGGGWIQGDKRDMRVYIPILQKEHPSHAVVNINYRLAKPGVRAAFPNQFLDLQKALEHLTSEADAFEIKAEFGLIGVSAGGHLALQYDNVYDALDQVKMVTSIVGPTNFKDPFYSLNPNFNVAIGYLVDRRAYTGVADLAKAVSPAYLINEDTSPTILFYGESDELVPVSNGKFLKQRLDAEGIVNSFTIYKGGHGDWQEDENKNLQLQLNNFIRTHLPVD